MFKWLFPNKEESEKSKLNKKCKSINKTIKYILENSQSKVQFKKYDDENLGEYHSFDRSAEFGDIKIYINSVSSENGILDQYILSYKDIIVYKVEYFQGVMSNELKVKTYRPGSWEENVINAAQYLKDYNYEQNFSPIKD